MNRHRPLSRASTTIFGHAAGDESATPAGRRAARQPAPTTTWPRASAARSSSFYCRRRKLEDARPARGTPAPGESPRCAFPSISRRTASPSASVFAALDTGELSPEADADARRRRDSTAPKQDGRNRVQVAWGRRKSAAACGCSDARGFAYSLNRRAHRRRVRRKSRRCM